MNKITKIAISILVLGAVGFMIWPTVISCPPGSNELRAKLDMKTNSGAMSMYLEDNGFYPSTEQGLPALVTKSEIEPFPINFPEGGYLKRTPKDPWGEEYRYEKYRKSDNACFRLYSLGPNKVLDTKNLVDDIVYEADEQCVTSAS